MLGGVGDIVSLLVLVETSLLRFFLIFFSSLGNYAGSFIVVKFSILATRV